MIVEYVTPHLFIYKYLNQSPAMTFGGVVLLILAHLIRPLVKIHLLYNLMPGLLHDRAHTSIYIL